MPLKRDWRDENDYEFTKKLTPQGWAWEFLRRNPDYQKDWKELLKRYQHETKRNSVPDRIDVKGAATKWGFFLDDLINPILDNPFPEPDWPIFKIPGGIYSSGDYILLSYLKPEEVAVVFDLSKPLKSQLENYKVQLENLQNEILRKKGNKIPKPKTRFENLATFLRVYDAKSDNSKHKEIADIIFPTYDNQGPNSNAERHVIDSYKAAKGYVEGKYREFVMKDFLF